MTTMERFSDEKDKQGDDLEKNLLDDDTSSESEKSEKDGRSDSMRYTIDDNPPILLSIFLGFQHYLIMFGPGLVVPLLLTPAMCMRNNDVDKSNIVCTIFFVSGLSTILQSTFGVRLPVIQGGTFTFLVPTFAILALPKFRCPVPHSDIGFNQTLGMNTSGLDNETGQTDEIWKIRMREVQGAIIVSSLFEVAIGLTGLIGVVLRYIGPLSIAPTLILIGISLFEATYDFCQVQWGIAIMTMVLLILFSQYMRKIQPKIPIPDFKRRRCQIKRQPVFQVFPVVISIGIMWLISFLLTITDVFPSDPSHINYNARTDSRISILMDAPWVRIPYPCQWGLPTVSVAGVFGMLAGVLAGILESVGDYYACAKISGAPIPPSHAINRGIFVEGLGCMLAGLWGSGNATTSYSENIGALSLTGVGSRRVIQMAGLIMIIFAMFGKIGALFVTIPDPIVGGILMVTFGMIAAVGVSSLQYVDLNSSRNLCIFGFATFFGLVIPEWLKKNPYAMDTGNEILSQILLVLFRTNMFVGGSIGFFLDNTIPGTDEERGIKEWRRHLVSDGGTTSRSTDKCYDIPFLTDCTRRSKLCKYIPILPAYGHQTDLINSPDKPNYGSISSQTAGIDQRGYENYAQTI